MTVTEPVPEFSVPDPPESGNDMRRRVSRARMPRRPHRVLAAAVGLALAVTLAACGDNGTESSKADSSGSAASGGGDIRIEFAVVGAGAFTDVIRNGAEQAGRDLGIKVVFNQTQKVDFPEQARLIRAVLAKKPDAMVVPNFVPAVTNPPIKEAVKAGIPVMLITAGLAEIDNVGALGYVGLPSEVESGMVAGRELKELGATNVVCFNADVGSLLHDQRCQGLSRGFGADAKVVGGDLNDRTKSRNAIKAVLQRDDTVDGIFATSSREGEEAAAAVKAAGKAGEIKVSTFDLTSNILNEIRDGNMAFTLDQQQWLQGYLPVLQLTHLLQYKLAPARVTSTGPALVTRDTAATVIELTRKGIR